MLKQNKTEPHFVAHYYLYNKLIANEVRIIKIIISLCFFLLTFATIIAKNNPATHYEASIYTSTPLYFWFCFILALIGGFSITIHQIYYQKYKTSNIWVLGMLIVSLCYVLILSLYVIRGYYMWNANGDISSHLKFIDYILNNARIPDFLFYPIVHIYVAELVSIVGLNEMLLIKLIPILFGLLYILFMYLFAKSIFHDNSQVILATLASTTFMHTWYLTTTPNHMSNLMFPLFLFTLMKSLKASKVSWKIILIILVILYPVFHPVPTLALTIILVALWLPEKISDIFTKKEHICSNKLSQLNHNLFTILFVWGIIWISSFGVWKGTIINIYNFVINEESASHIASLTEKVTYAQSYGYNVYEQIFKVEGISILYFTLALISFPIILNELHFNKKIRTLFLLYSPLFIITMITAGLYFLNIGFSPLRMVIYINILTTIFVGYLLNKTLILFRNVKNNHLARFAYSLIILLFIGIFLHGMMALYPSPYIMQSSYYTTQTEIVGVDWLFNHKNSSIEISKISITPWRFADLLLTPEKAIEQNITAYNNNYVPPYHFGYNNNIFISDSYYKDMYLTLVERDKSIYTDVYPDMAELRWDLEDFEKLESDWSANKLYSNEAFDLWYINVQRR